VGARDPQQGVPANEAPKFGLRLQHPDLSHDNSAVNIVRITAHKGGHPVDWERGVSAKIRALAFSEPRTIRQAHNLVDVMLSKPRDSGQPLVNNLGLRRLNDNRAARGIAAPLIIRTRLHA
jgi:hypothetical protein